MSIMGAIVEKQEDSIVDIAREYLGLDSAGKLRDSSLRERLTRHLMHEQAAQWSRHRLFEQQSMGVRETGLPLTMKYISTTELQREDELMLAILGNRGLSWHDEEFSGMEQRLVKNWAYNKAQTIAGGTSEIQLNIIAKRALRLPDH